MNLIFAQTADDLKLPGFHYPVANKDLCVLFVHGMAGSILESVFGHVLGKELKKQNIGYIYTHNRGYSYINDLSTSQKNSDHGFITKRNGSIYERFAGCVPDIEAWLKKGRALGYQRFIIVGHSLGSPKVVHHFFKKHPKDVIGLVLASPADMVGLVTKPDYQPNYPELLQEAQQNLKKGRPQKILSSKIWNNYLISSQTFLDFFLEGGPADNLPLFRNPASFPELETINVPTLCLMGEFDDVAIRTLEEDLALLQQKAVNAPSFDTFILPGANHDYAGKEKEFAQEIIKWIKRKMNNPR